MMPLSICRRIGNLKIDSTRMTLQLVDRSITRPYGVVEDVLVKVRHFTFPVDFVIMDIEKDAKIPLILGRPFMLTTNYVVDMGNGNLEMSVENQKVTLTFSKRLNTQGKIGGASRWRRLIKKMLVLSKSHELHWRKL